jgi:hypothetical protein
VYRGKLLLLTLGLVCSACPSPNTFTTPRTVAAGKVQHTVSVEAIGAFAEDDSVVLPTLPSYTARIGLADRLELGVHFSHLSSIGADFKWNPVRTDGFDLAIDPGAQAFYFVTGDASVVIYYLHLPVLLGFNVADNVSLVLTPGVSMLGVGGTIDSGDDELYGGSDSAWLARAGFGVDIRASEKFSVQPEVTFLKSFESGGGVVFLGGVGFKFGAQPEY